MSSTPSRSSRRQSSSRLQDTIQGSTPTKASPTPNKRTPARRSSTAAPAPTDINTIALTSDERALASRLHISATCFLLVSEENTSITAPRRLVGSKYSTERKVRLAIGEFLFSQGRINKRRLDGQRTDDKEEGRGGDIDPSDDELDVEVLIEVDERGRPLYQSVPEGGEGGRGGRSVRARVEKKKAVVVEKKEKKEKKVAVVEGKGKGKAREEPMMVDEASSSSSSAEEEEDDDEDEDFVEQEEDEDADRRAAAALAALFVQRVKEAEAQAKKAASVQPSEDEGSINLDSLWPTPPPGSRPKATLPQAAPAIASSSSRQAQPVASSSSKNATATTSSKPIQPSPPQPIASSSKPTINGSSSSNLFPPPPAATSSDSAPLILNPLILPPSPRPNPPNQPTPTTIPALVYLSLHLQTYRLIIKNFSRLQPDLYPTSNGEKWKASVMKVLNGDKRIRRKGLDRFTWKYGRGPGSRWDV